MIKKTLYFGNPAYLSLRNCQLVYFLEWRGILSGKTGKIGEMGKDFLLFVVLCHNSLNFGLLITNHLKLKTQFIKITKQNGKSFYS